MNVAAHQEKEKNEKAGKIEAVEKKNSLPISKKLRAALLRSFRGQHGEKMVCVRGMPGAAGTFEKANNHFNSSQTESGTAAPR